MAEISRHYSRLFLVIMYTKTHQVSEICLSHSSPVGFALIRKNDCLQSNLNPLALTRSENVKEFANFVKIKESGVE